MMALPHDMIGMSTSIGGGNLMPPFGAADRRIGNNPFSVAFPAGERDPVVLDMAQSVVAKGKIVMATKTNSPIPPEWALDADGVPTTDPAAAIQGFLRCMGDYKGSGLSIAIGMLSSMLAGAAIGPNLRDVYEDFAPLNKGHSFWAIKIDFLQDAAEFRRNMDVQIDFIKNARRAPGVDEIFLPGEMEARNYRRQMAEGIEMPGEVLQELVALSERLQVRHPFEAAALRA
jgi:LDH2 family malate/lactate/ureidoglycolate dehydrogenase